MYGQVISYGVDIYQMAVLANSLFQFMSEIERVLAMRSLGCAFTPADAPRGRTQHSPLVEGWVTVGLWDWRDVCEPEMRTLASAR